MIQIAFTLASVTVNNNSPIQDYVHPDDHTQPTYEMTPGFKPGLAQINNKVSHKLLKPCSYLSCSKYFSQGLFLLNENTGEITVAMSLDRESNKTLRMVLRADDGGQPKRSDQSEVEFVLTDVNDNAPVIRPQKSVASVFEVQRKQLSS